MLMRLQVFGALSTLAVLTYAATGRTEPPSPPVLESGSFKVCDVGDHDRHGQHQGIHLELGDTVVIGELDLVTDVQFGRQVLSMIRSDQQLASTYEFAHQTSRGVENVTHLVRIRPDSTYRRSPLGTCEGSNVYIVEFCTKQSDGATAPKWNCTPDNAHAGAVHIHSGP
jgi:hypothetical protein